MSELALQEQHPLQRMLESLLRLIEHQSPAMQCSVLLLDQDGVTLRHGAAPRLPEAYCRAIDGLRIGAGVGSCGTAAFERRRTIVENIATHDYWAAFRDVALPAGLRACWSTPIFGTTGECLGTFAMYYDQPRAPEPADLEVIDTAALLAGALIERERLLAASEADRLALTEVNAQLEEQQLELEIANRQLQDNAAELEMLNQQLQENATELEAQAEALEEANAELRASDERLRDIIEQAPVAIAVLVGAEHVYEVVSPRYRQLAGRELLGEPLARAFPEAEAAQVHAIVDRVYATAEPFYAVEQHVLLDRDRDGVPEDAWLNLAYTPLRDRTGKVYAVVSASVDVTEQVRARLALEEARAEAERANRVKSEFLATMSHELRTPLNAIIGYSDLLLAGVRGPLASDQHTDVARMKRSGEHLLALINDILNFAKLEAGRVEFHVQDVRLGVVVRGIEELMRPQVDARSLTYSQRLAAEELAVRADPEKLRQVLLNLVTNAVKFTEPGGRISLECDCTAAEVRITVSDTGRGIPGEQLSRIFDPFVQVDRDRTPTSQRGVGLGLSICRDLAAGMGGSLSVTSRVGEGSSFTLTLPRGEASAALTTRPRQEQATTGLGATQLQL